MAQQKVHQQGVVRILKLLADRKQVPGYVAFPEMISLERATGQVQTSPDLQRLKVSGARRR
jgi:hypothetical protein